MIPVTISGTITDAESGVKASSVEYAVTDEYGLLQPRGHLTLSPSGNYSFTVRFPPHVRAMTVTDAAITSG
jgi:hypothetical protein